MIYLILSILSSTAIFVLFKLFNKYNIDTLQAIVVNYFTAFAFGIIANNQSVNIKEIIETAYRWESFLPGTRH